MPKKSENEFIIGSHFTFPCKSKPKLEEVSEKKNQPDPSFSVNAKFVGAIVTGCLF